jgi:glycosyltransferase involved in cell wall biosynthesis
VIPAHDEAAIIEAKLRNVLAIDYPRDRLQVAVISDGSTDDTCARVRALLAALGPEERGRVVLVERKERSGKSRALSEEVPKLDAEVLVFTDANAFFRPDAIRRLVEPFADPRVGLACGRLRYVPDAGSFMSDEELYWRYEDVIKAAEGRAGRLLVGNGSIYALRAALFRPIPGSVADDFAMPLLVAASRQRLVYAPDAVAEERLPAQGIENFRAKARIVTRGATALRLYWRDVLRSGPLRVVQYLLHKVARWLMGFVLAALFAVSLLGASHPLLATALTAQVAFYLLGFAAWLLARRGPVPGLLRLPFYFLLVNAAALAGLLDFAVGRRRVIWEKSETTRRSPDEEIALSRPHDGGVPVGRPFSRRAGLLVALALAGAGLLAAETGARLTYGMRDGLRALRGAVPPKGSLRFYEIPDPVHPGNWLLRPGVRATLSQIERAGGAAAESRLGMRARELGIAPEEVVLAINDRGYKGPALLEGGDRPRILALGDACAFGSMIDRYSYPRVLERELGRLGVPAEVVNVGVSGYYPAHVLVRIDEFAALTPDVSLICVGWNALYGERYTPTTLIDSLYLLRVATALSGRWRSWGTSPREMAEELQERARRIDPTDPEIERLSRYTPPFVDDVRKIGERLRAAGSRVFVLTLPSLYLSGERPTQEALAIGTLPRFTDNPYVLAAAAARYNQLLRELTDENGFQVIDLASWSRETLQPRHAYFASASALNELGQERMGERVAERLAAELRAQPVAP